MSVLSLVISEFVVVVGEYALFLLKDRATDADVVLKYMLQKRESYWKLIRHSGPLM